MEGAEADAAMNAMPAHVGDARPLAVLAADSDTDSYRFECVAAVHLRLSWRRRWSTRCGPPQEARAVGPRAPPPPPQPAPLSLPLHARLPSPCSAHALPLADLTATNLRAVAFWFYGRVFLEKQLTGVFFKNNSDIKFFLLRVELNFNTRTYLKNIRMRFLFILQVLY